MENITLEDIGFENNQLFLLKPKNIEDWVIDINNRTVHLNGIVQIETLESYGDDPKEENGFKYNKMLTLSLLPIWDEISDKFKEGAMQCNEITLDKLYYPDLDGYCGYGAYIRFMDIDFKNIDDSFIPQGKFVAVFVRENENIKELIEKIIIPRMDEIIRSIECFLDVQSRLCGTTNRDEIEEFV